MGTEQSNWISSEPIDLSQWKRVRAQNGKNNYININDKTLVVEQNFISIEDDQLMHQLQQMHKLRKNSHDLVGSHYLRMDEDKKLCSTSYNGQLYLQKMPITLSNLQDIPFPDVLHLYSQSLSGFHHLSKQYGYFIINQDCIGINSKNVVKVWHSHEFDKVFPGNRTTCEENMVLNLVNLIQQHTDKKTLPPQQPSIVGYIFKHSNSITFSDAKHKLNQYASQYNQGHIPPNLLCTRRLGGYEVIPHKTQHLPPYHKPLPQVSSNPIPKPIIINEKPKFFNNTPKYSSSTVINKSQTLQSPVIQSPLIQTQTPQSPPIQSQTFQPPSLQSQTLQSQTLQSQHINKNISSQTSLPSYPLKLTRPTTASLHLSKPAPKFKKPAFTVVTVRPLKFFGNPQSTSLISSPKVSKQASPKHTMKEVRMPSQPSPEQEITLGNNLNTRYSQEILEAQKELIQFRKERKISEERQTKIERGLQPRIAKSINTGLQAESFALYSFGNQEPTDPKPINEKGPFSTLMNTELKESIVEEQYNMDWDPEILADLKAKVHHQK